MKKIKRYAQRLVIGSIMVAVLISRWVPTQADATIMINYTDSKGAVTFNIGESYELKGSEYVDSSSQQKIADITKDSLALQNQHVIGFGSTALWTDPTERDPNNWDWNSLDAKIETMRLASGTDGADIVITLGMAPVWMTTHQAKSSPSYPAYENWTDYPGANPGSPNTKYSENPALGDDSITEDTINASVDPWFEDDFAFMAAAVAERYPDVKTFQVWNEMKGYYLSSENHWDYEQYTSLYNKVYTAVKNVRPDAKLGGPYVVMSSWHDESSASHPSSIPECQGSWGVFDQRDLDVISYWLEHKAGADYLLVDTATTTNHDSDPGFDQFQTKEKTDALRKCIDTLTEASSASDQLLPIGIAEYYPKANGGVTQQQAAAITANALGDTIQNKFNYVLLWDLMGKSCDPLDSASLIALSTSVNDADCPNSAQQGQPSALAPVLSGIKERFGNGALLYAPQFDTTKVGVFASNDGIMLVNKLNSSQDAIINSCAPINLSAYEVKFIDILDCVAPSAPSNTTIEVNGTTASLSWDASTDATSTVTGYRVYRNGIIIAALNADHLSLDDTYNGDDPIDLVYAIEAIDDFNNISDRATLASITITPEQSEDPDDGSNTNTDTNSSGGVGNFNFSTVVPSAQGTTQALPGTPSTGARASGKRAVIGMGAAAVIAGISFFSVVYLIRKYR